jgi:hypothetical protein
VFFRHDADAQNYGASSHADRIRKEKGVQANRNDWNKKAINRKNLAIVLLFIAGIAGIVSQADAVGICEAKPATIWPEDSAVSSLIYGNTYGASNGMWAVTSGGYTVSGISQCSTSSLVINSTNGTGGSQCWCRMMSPVVGLSWVFMGANTFGSSDDCANSCAFRCTTCIKDGTYNLCARSAVLASS